MKPKVCSIGMNEYKWKRKTYFVLVKLVTTKSTHKLRASLSRWSARAVGYAGWVKVG